MWATIDYMFRAFAGIWFAMGLMLAWIIPSIERHSAWLGFIFLAVFAMGVGRLISLTAFGPIPTNSIGAMFAELVLPPVYVFWQRKVASQSRAGSSAAEGS